MAGRAAQDIITIVHHNRANGATMRSWGWFMNIAFRSAHGRCILMMSDIACSSAARSRPGLHALLPRRRPAAPSVASHSTFATGRWAQLFRPEDDRRNADGQSRHLHARRARDDWLLRRGKPTASTNATAISHSSSGAPVTT